MDEILKVQKSITSSDGIEKLLIYNEDRSFFEEFSRAEDPEMFDEIDQMLAGRLKIYITFSIDELMEKGDNDELEDVKCYEVENPGW